MSPTKKSWIDLMWGKFNTSEETLKLETWHDNPRKRIIKEIKPGQRIVLPKQLQAIKALHKKEALTFGGALGGGKIVYKGNSVLTPHGFKKIEDIEEGCLVNNPDGTVAEIIRLTEWQEHQVWRVHFHDGTYTDVAEGHLWLAWRAGKTRKADSTRMHGQDAARVCTTKKLKQWTDEAKVRAARKPRMQASYPCIPVCQPQKFNATSRNPDLIDPYLLGTLLGDGSIGSASNISITTADHEHFKEQFGHLSYGSSTKEGNTASAYFFTYESKKQIAHALTTLKLIGTKSNDKFIPRVFKLGSIETRWAIVQGLMDTDGTVSPDGKTYFCSVSKQLADDVAFIIRSLGGVVTITQNASYCNGERKQDSYDLYIKHPEPTKLFRLKRKIERAKNLSEHRTYFRKVVDVEILDERKVGRCITVSHPNGLYLTDDFVVTHNSKWLRDAAIYWAVWLRRRYGISGARIGIFSETKEILRDRHIVQLQQYPSWVGTYNSDAFEFRLSPVLGAGVITLRNLRDTKDYQSMEWYASFIDEANKNSKEKVDDIASRTRGPVGSKFEDIHCPLAYTGNPGGIGHSWMFKEFVDPSTRVQPHWIDIKNRKPYWHKGNAFIQSLPYDNPFLPSSYWAKLDRLPEKQKRAWLEGDWRVFQGQYFPMLNPAVHYIAPFVIPDNWNHFRAIDLGGAHPTVCLWGSVDPNGDLYVWDEYSVTGGYYEKHKAEMARRSKHYKFRATVSDRRMFTGDYSAEGNKTPEEIFNSQKDEYGSFDVVMSPVDDRVSKWLALADAFSYEAEESPLYDANNEPIIQFVRKPKIFLFSHLEHTMSSLTLITHDENKADDAKKTKGYYGPGEGDDEAETLANLWAVAHPSAPIGRQRIKAKDELKAYIKRAKSRINGGNTPRSNNAKF